MFLGAMFMFIKRFDILIKKKNTNVTEQTMTFVEIASIATEAFFFV